MATIVLIMASENDNVSLRCGSLFPVDPTLIGEKFGM